MARQDIYGTIGDDILGVTGHTSSLRGKVSKINVWINTDVAGSGEFDFIFDKEKNTVKIVGSIPESWILNVERLKKVV